jgi:hypothetical protein
MSGRFSPNEALATINEVVAHRERTKCEVDPDGGPDPGVLLSQGDAETIHNQVNALRAYLAGRTDAVQEHGKCGCCGVDMAYHVYLDEQVNRLLMQKSVAEKIQRLHHHKGCPVVMVPHEPAFQGVSEPLTRAAIDALKQEAENAPDVPGSADWGRKAVLRLIASHEELRKSIYREFPDGRDVYGLCVHCGVPWEREVILDRMVNRDILTEVSAAEIKRSQHRRGCPYSGRYPIPYWARPEPFFRVTKPLEYVTPEDGILTVGPFKPGSTVEIRVR